MAKLLAIETSSEACSVALSLNGDRQQRHLLAPRQHANRILGLVDELTSAAGVALSALDAIAVGRGPGSFTGIRIGVAVAQGLALGGDLPVLPVSSLHTLALLAHQREGAARVLAAFDARMDEIYCAGFEFASDPHGRIVLDEQVSVPVALTLPADEWLGVGSGFARYRAELQDRLGARLSDVRPDLLPEAGALADLAAIDWAAGRAISAERLEPSYLRNQVTRVSPG